MDWSINPEPSNQTNLNKCRRCNLGDGGGIEAKADMWDQGAGRPACPLRVCLGGMPSGGLWNLLELVFTADKRNFI
jgi:hypothetical protein